VPAAAPPITADDAAGCSTTSWTAGAARVVLRRVLRLAGAGRLRDDERFEDLVDLAIVGISAVSVHHRKRL
jgi:hypothetical protein